MRLHTCRLHSGHLRSAAWSTFRLAGVAQYSVLAVRSSSFGRTLRQRRAAAPAGRAARLGESTATGAPSMTVMPSRTAAASGGDSRRKRLEAASAERTSSRAASTIRPTTPRPAAVDAVGAAAESASARSRMTRRSTASGLQVQQRPQVEHGEHPAADVREAGDESRQPRHAGDLPAAGRSRVPQPPAARRTNRRCRTSITRRPASDGLSPAHGRIRCITRCLSALTSLGCSRCAAGFTSDGRAGPPACLPTGLATTSAPRASGRPMTADGSERESPEQQERELRRSLGSTLLPRSDLDEPRNSTTSSQPDQRGEGRRVACPPSRTRPGSAADWRRRAIEQPDRQQLTEPPAAARRRARCAAGDRAADGRRPRAPTGDAAESGSRNAPKRPSRPPPTKSVR